MSATPSASSRPTRPLPAPSPLASHWGLSRDVCFLNHGSFGATPTRVLERQSELRARMEAEPVRFFVEDYEPLMDKARREAAAFVGCDPDDFAFVSNATMGVNAVVSSLPFSPGDELVTSGQEYNACNNALRHAAAKTGAVVVSAELPWPVVDEEQVVRAIMARVTSRTRLVMVSHVTSPTGLVLPVERIVREVQARGIDTLVDGAHGPGMLPLHVERIGAAYYTGNFHKWVCAPKGAAFLHVRRDRQEQIRPVVISHGANSQRTDRSRFRLEFDFLGVTDVTPYLCVPDSIKAVAAMGSNAGVAEGWTEIRRRMRDLALRGRKVLCEALGAAPPAPESMIGSLAAALLPDRRSDETQGKYMDPLQDRLVLHGIQVPIVPFPQPPKRLVRISAAPYNSIEQVEHLAAALLEELAAK